MQDDRSGEQIEGTIERIVFHNPDNGWTVLRVMPEDGVLIDTVVGKFQQLNAGERMRFKGRWRMDPKHGRQFSAVSSLPLAPATLKGIEKFLGSGLSSGIGPVTAKRIVDRFGLETLDVIEKSPSKVAEIPGIGPKRANALREALGAKKSVQDVMIFLESVGITPAFAVRIYKRFGDDSIRVVQETPYRLAWEVGGIGFRIADQIAEKVGISRQSPERAEAGLIFALEEWAGDGHVFAWREDLLARADELLNIETGILETALSRLLLMGRARRRDLGKRTAIYLPRLFTAEEEASRGIVRLLTEPLTPLDMPPGEAVAKAELALGVEFAQEQRGAFSSLGRSRLLVLTGGPGTGKTTVLRGLVDYLTSCSMSVVLAAPTGRAARRMAESTKREARTLHRLLEYTPKTNSFERNRQNPLVADMVVIDEVSMVDIELFAALLEALGPGARLLLVGDPDQLPSVGPGRVLGDILAMARSRETAVEAVCLQQIFRQAAKSHIVTGAHSVLAGKEPETGAKGSDSDLFMIEREAPDDCLSTIEELVSKRIPARFGFDPVADIQVLTPMHKGILGTANLNERLQELLNPGEGGISSRGYRYRVGDKVMQIRNNYDLDVFNGDIGRISTIGEERDWIEVTYDERKVRYPSAELDQLTLAYACSVHKSQGSEYPVIVLPLHTQHFVMLQRNLLYTGITRGKRLVVIVGNKRALSIAVRNETQSERSSLLVSRVQGELNN